MSNKEEENGINYAYDFSSLVQVLLCASLSVDYLNSLVSFFAPKVTSILTVIGAMLD
jgi:hypothetical protein